MTRTTRTVGPLAVGLLLLLGLLGCGDDPAAGHTEADVAFATDMVPHHAQAVEMVEMTEGRPLSPEVADLAAGIEAAQAPEIQQMSDWLRAWGEDVPPSDGSMDMPGDDGDMAMGSVMPGMMTSAEMTSLEQASDTDFERLWLQMMVQHHVGAVDMARAELRQGSYRPARALAEEIITSQTTEIATMRRLLEAG